MIIKNAEQATEQARRIIGNPPRFLFKPRECKRKNGFWIVTTITGIVDNIEVTVKMPEKLLDAF